VAAILRDGQVLVAGGQSRLRAGDRLVVISSPQDQQQALHILAGEDI
jgi:Trk K+ transport system NAD-binding subunit